MVFSVPRLYGLEQLRLNLVFFNFSAAKIRCAAKKTNLDRRFSHDIQFGINKKAVGAHGDHSVEAGAARYLMGIRRKNTPGPPG